MKEQKLHYSKDNDSGTLCGLPFYKVEIAWAREDTTCERCRRTLVNRGILFYSDFN